MYYPIIYIGYVTRFFLWWQVTVQTLSFLDIPIAEKLRYYI